MTPSQLRDARLLLGLSLDQMAGLLGYSGATRKHTQYALEHGIRTVRNAQARLVEAYLAGYRPDDWP